MQTSVACPTEAPEKQGNPGGYIWFRGKMLTKPSSATGKRSRLEDAESTVVKNGIVRAYDKIQYALDGYGEELCCPM